MHYDLLMGIIMLKHLCYFHSLLFLTSRNTRRCPGLKWLTFIFTADPTRLTGAQMVWLLFLPWTPPVWRGRRPADSFPLGTPLYPWQRVNYIRSLKNIAKIQPRTPPLPGYATLSGQGVNYIRILKNIAALPAPCSGFQRAFSRWYGRF